MSKVIDVTPEVEGLLNEISRLKRGVASNLEDAAYHESYANNYRERATTMSLELKVAEESLVAALAGVQIRDLPAPSVPSVPSPIPVGAHVKPIRLVNYNGGILSPAVTTDTIGICGATDEEGDVYVAWQIPEGYSNYMSPSNLVVVNVPHRYAMGDRVVALYARNYAGSDISHLISPGDIGSITFVYNDGDYDVKFDSHDESIAMSPGDIRPI